MNLENINNQFYNSTFLYPKDISEALSSNASSNAMIFSPKVHFLTQSNQFSLWLGTSTTPTAQDDLTPQSGLNLINHSLVLTQFYPLSFSSILSTTLTYLGFYLMMLFFLSTCITVSKLRTSLRLSFLICEMGLMPSRLNIV